MQHKWFEDRLDYDGSQLRTLFAYQTFGILGDSIVAFSGACDVKMENMIDGEDRFQSQKICGGNMLHFIVEKFRVDIFSSVALQRLLASSALEVLVGAFKIPAHRLTRDGDDLYFDGGKLSISIATVSPISALIHFAVNITNEGTPVKTASLGDLNIDTKNFAITMIEKFSKELNTLETATKKVFPAH